MRGHFLPGDRVLWIAAEFKSVAKPAADGEDRIMIMLAFWVLMFLALGVGAHFFGADTRDPQFSMRMTAARTGSAKGQEVR
jgi:hypothetical protein